MVQSSRDVEESEDTLNATEKDPVQFWEKKQRELVVSVVDYNLNTLAELIQSKTIDLSPRYQRRFRWDDARQSKLIESFLMNVPVPPIFLNEDRYGKYSVIDGKQRLSAIFEFLRGRLKLCDLEVFSDINGKTFDDLPPDLQNVIKLRPTLRAVIILRQSDEDIKFEVFQRLNTGGVRLNPQEIRNSTWPGPLNDLILDLSESEAFHAALGIKDKRNSVIYQEMRDAEFVLRYFTFRDTWETFTSGMRRCMDHFMVAHQRLTKKTRDELEKDFLATVAVVRGAYGEYAFRRWLPEKGQWRRQVLASMYDAEMFACRGLSVEKVERCQKAIIAGTKALFGNEDFRRSIDAATNASASFRHRINAMKAVLAKALKGKG
jgi:hypothetical protein